MKIQNKPTLDKAYWEYMQSFQHSALYVAEDQTWLFIIYSDISSSDLPFWAASNSMAACLYGLDNSIAKFETNLHIMYLFNVLIKSENNIKCFNTEN